MVEKIKSFGLGHASMFKVVGALVTLGLLYTHIDNFKVSIMGKAERDVFSIEKKLIQ